MPEAKVRRIRVYTKQCMHLHFSGRRCSARYGRDAFGRYRNMCKLHEDRECEECNAMMRAFPIRKTVQEIPDGSDHSVS